jgi:hypothetical protein
MPPSITQSQLAEWQRLSDEATSGPWQKWNEGHGPRDLAPFSVVTSAGGDDPNEGNDTTIAERATRPNAAFIAAARTALPLLLAALAERERELAEARSARDALAEERDDANGGATLNRCALKNALRERDEALASLDVARAEVAVLRGEDCLVDGDGPCGACLKCSQASRDEALTQRDMLAGGLNVATEERSMLAKERDAAHEAIARIASRLGGAIGSTWPEACAAVINGVAALQASRDEALAEVERQRQYAANATAWARREEQETIVALEKQEADRSHLTALVQTLEPLVVSRAASRPLREALARACAHLGLGPDGEAKEETK